MAAEHELEFDFEMDISQSERLKHLLREAATEVPICEYPTGSSLVEMHPRLPRWPSGLGPQFDSIFDGFQGITVLGGDAGVGKSTLSMSCALTNAIDGALVIYADAENAAGEQRNRAVRWCGSEEAFQEAQDKLALNLRWTPIDNRNSWGTLLLYAAKQVSHRHRRVLFVMDSLQTISDEISGGRNMLQVTADLYSRMNRIVRQSEGLISFLVLSELNKEAQIKGGAGKYRATMVLRIAREDAMEGQVDPEYMLSLTKNRNGRTPGDIGLYTMNWWRCRFMPVVQQ